MGIYMLISHLFRYQIGYIRYSVIAHDQCLQIVQSRQHIERPGT